MLRPCQTIPLPSRGALVAAFALAVSAVAAGPASAQWTVTVLEPPGATYSEADRVRDGQIVGWVNYGNGAEAALWTAASAASYVNLHPGSTLSQAKNVQAGRQVGHNYPASTAHAGYWTGTAGSFVDLNPAGASNSSAYDIEGDQMAGEARFGTLTQAGIWSVASGQWTSLHPVGTSPPAAASSIHATDGFQQVGTAGFGGSTVHAFLWSGNETSWVDLHPGAAASSNALDVHAGQQVGIAVFGFNNHAALWSGSAASFVDLTPPGKTVSYANGVHQGEQVGVVQVSIFPHAALWSGSAASWVDLQDFLPGTYTASQAIGIWHGPDGTTYVVGTGNEGTHTRALLWTKAPPVWTDLGFALPGAGGPPSLVGNGALTTGSSGSLALTQAAASAASMLFVSLSRSAAPFKGGTLVPVPVIFMIGFPTSPSGTLTLPWNAWPGGLSGLSLYFQFAIADAGAPGGVALSNAVRGNVP